MRRSRSFADKGIPKPELGNEGTGRTGKNEANMRRSRRFADKGIPKPELGNEGTRQT